MSQIIETPDSPLTALARWLSRWPLALEVHAFSSQKRLLVGRLALAGRSLAVAAVHLTSNHKADAPGKRRDRAGADAREELEAIRAEMAEREKKKVPGRVPSADPCW